MFKQSQILLTATLLCGIATSSYAELSAYEEPPVLATKDVLDQDFLVSDLYTIEDDVITRGYTNTYRITSEYGNFTAHGNAMLEKILHEINVIHELDKIKNSEQFSEGLKEGAKIPFRFVKNLITHPVDTVTGVPKGI